MDASHSTWSPASAVFMVRYFHGESGSEGTIGRQTGLLVRFRCPHGKLQTGFPVSSCLLWGAGSYSICSPGHVGVLLGTDERSHRPQGEHLPAPSMTHSGKLCQQPLCAALQPVLLVGNISAGCSILALGLSPNFAAALVSRFTGGLLTSATGV